MKIRVNYGIEEYTQCDDSIDFEVEDGLSEDELQAIADEEAQDHFTPWGTYEVLELCARCGDYFSTDEMVTLDDDLYCQDCAEYILS